jgi:hypothetical protein
VEEAQRKDEETGTNAADSKMEFEAVIAVKDRKRIEPQSTLCEY